MTDDERFCSESNVSFIARIAWKYRINPAQLVSKAILNKKRTNADLRYGVATLCNSLSDKSLQVQDKLYELTGQDRSSGNYTYLRGLVDHAAHGLLSEEKKWCHLCYQDRRNMGIATDETAMHDDLYWSFRHSKYCTEHHCTLSNKCGHCFHQQPYISYKVEPGYCHHCRRFLGIAPSIEVGDDADADEMAAMELAKHDLFLINGVPREHISMSVLARNLRQLANRFGQEGMDMVSSACGVNSMTYTDWCRAKHNVTVESLFMLLDGLELPSLGSLLTDEAEFCSTVSPQLSSQFQFRTKKHHESVLPGITKYLNDIIVGTKPPEPRQAIANRFNVSVGMLENAFADELKAVSHIYHTKIEGLTISRNVSLQHLMDIAVRRCGSKMRKFDWHHILAELKGINLANYSHAQLSDARQKAVERYIHSSRRDQSRDIDSLL